MYKTQKVQTISQKKNTVYLLKMQTLLPKNKQNNNVEKLQAGRRLLQHITNSREYINNSYKS